MKLTVTIIVVGTMTVLTCPVCGYATEDVDVIGAAALMNAHSTTHQQQPQPAQVQTTTRHAPKLERPKLKLNASNEEWNMFFRRWTTYKVGSHITDDVATSQLLECTTEELGDVVLRAYPDFTAKPITEAITILKSLAVVPVALGVLRAELTSMHQEADEKFRTFASRVQGKAETCELLTTYDGTCSQCNTAYSGTTYYSTEYIRDVLLSGIADLDIRREALSVADMQQKSINDIIAFVETREIARNANKQPDVASMSSYRNSKRQPFNQRRQNLSPSPSERAETANCPDCGQSFHIYTLKSRGWNKKTHTHCQECWRKNLAVRRTDSANNAISGQDQFGQVATLTAYPGRQHRKNGPRRRGPRRRKTYNIVNDTGELDASLLPTDEDAEVVTPLKHRGRRTKVVLSHHIFTKAGWRRARLADHPRTALNLSPEHDSRKTTMVQGLADSGAQSNVWSLREYLAAGLSLDDLSPVTLALNAANKSTIRIDGAFFVTLSGETADGSVMTCKTMVYVSRDVNGFYLSYSTMLDLGMLPPTFPTPGCALVGASPSDFETIPVASSNGISTNSLRSIDAECATCTAGDDKSCREEVPEITELPFPCTAENIDRMKEWLLDTFGKSTFNRCPHHSIPSMSGPPMEIHVDENAKPFRCFKAAPIPVHWEQKVYDDLKRDEALGIIERVPYGEPVEWCHRMLVTRKHDGSPRRVVDLSPLNRYCKRESHNCESPFHVARRVPAHTFKTVTDVWNGYHLVELRESDRHLTTFASPYGLFRYRRAVQGYVSSGDGFNRRFDSVLAEFGRKERVVDDTLHYDEDLEAHWWRTIELLTLAGKSGIIFNPEKFQFGQREVDFAGFRIGEDRIDPLPKYFGAIRDFPTPKSTTDIRSWFGLVNQVANYAQLRDIMAPFRPFLSERHPFHWNEELDRSFITSKEAIITAIREGVEIFYPKRRTCLRTD